MSAMDSNPMRSSDHIRTPEVARAGTWKSVDRFASRKCDEVVPVSFLHDEDLCLAS